MSRFSVVFIGAFCGLILTPLMVWAHEVYVIDPVEVTVLANKAPVSFVDIFLNNKSETIIWGLLVTALILIVFFVSISVRLEDRFDGFLIRLKHYAPFIARVTAGLAFISCGYYGGLFGPELPFTDVFGPLAVSAQVAFMIMGVILLLGFNARIIGLIGLAIYIYAFSKYGWYMLTYTNYLGEFIVLMLVGTHRIAMPHRIDFLAPIYRVLDYLSRNYGEYAFFLLRIGFGFSLIFASIYAKVIHNQLAIAVVNNYHLQNVFIFSPEFIVFGAAIIEVTLGIFFILGIEIRFIAIVLNIFLTLSLLYFGEAVWPHIILIGVPIAFFCYGYDKYSLEGRFFKHGNREPIF